MKMIIALTAFVAVTIAAPLDADIKVVNESPSDNTGFTDYKYGYQLSNGATKEEYGQLTDVGTEGQHYIVTGKYSFVDPKTNIEYTVKYLADKDGFHAEGAHLPV